MSALKDKFENYKQQPDGKVWQSIQDSLKKRTIVRRSAVALSAIAVSSAVLVFALNRNGNVDPLMETNPVLAENVRTTQVVSPQADAPASGVTENVLQQPMKESVKQPTVSEEYNENVLFDRDFLQKESVAQTVESTTPDVVKNEVKVSTMQTEVVAAQTPSVTESTKEETPQTKVQQQPKAPAEDLVIWIPNAFSPDDPINDNVRQFKVFPNSDANIISYEIFIYSRTGRQVYHSKDITAGWDGTCNGHPQPMGTYVYIIEVNDVSKGLQHKKGTITLVR